MRLLDLPDDLLHEILLLAVRGATPDHVALLLSVSREIRRVLTRATQMCAATARPLSNQRLLLRDCASLQSLIVYGQRSLPLLQVPYCTSGSLCHERN